MSLSLRNYHGLEDLQRMLDIRLRCVEADKIDIYSLLEAIPTLEQFEKDIHDNQCDPSNDIVLAFNASECVGYTRVGWWTEIDGICLYLQLGNVLPTWRTKGVGELLLDWSENRIREISRHHDTKGKGMYGANATSSEKEYTQLLLSRGYIVTFPLAEMDFKGFAVNQIPSLPDEFEARKVEEFHVRKIWEMNNAVYATRQFTHLPTEEDFREFSTHPLNDYNLWDVAWHENEIAGVVISRIQEGRAEVFEVSVAEPYRRRGLAYALLWRNLTHLKERNCGVIRLYTNGDNVAGARSLYEKIGFKHVKDFNRYRKPIIQSSAAEAMELSSENNLSAIRNGIKNDPHF